MLATSWRTLSSRPRPIEDTPITTATPITIPSTVSPERSLLLLMVSVAIWTISPNSLFRTMDPPNTLRFPALPFLAPEAQKLESATSQIATPQSDRVWPLYGPDKLRRTRQRWRRQSDRLGPPRV